MMSGPELIREDHVEPLHFEATDTGSRRSYRSTVVTDRERLIEATYDQAAGRVVVTETVLTAFRTGVDPVAHSRTGLSLTLGEARALNARLSRLLADALGAPAAGEPAVMCAERKDEADRSTANAVLRQVEG